MNTALSRIFTASIIAVASVAPASAEIATEGEWGKVQFYGSLRALVTKEKEQESDVADGVSRIGIKGHVNLSDDWKGTYRLEGRIVLDDGVINSDASDYHKRITFVGLKNNEVGEIRLGKQYSPHYLWTVMPIDITFHNPRHYNIRWNASENSSIREANSVAYFSPSYNGLSFGVLAEIDGDDTQSSDVDSYNIAAKYTTGAWQLGVSYFDRSDDMRINDAIKPDANTFAAAVQYKANNHKVVLRYQNEDVSDGTEFNTVGVYYSYTLASGITPQFRIYNLDNGIIKGNQMAIGATKKFNKYGEVFIEYTNYDDEAAQLKKRDDDITVGVKISF
ncbi:MAG: putative porin [Colwellia polaris]|jgi:predicted porin